MKLGSSFEAEQKIHSPDDSEIESAARLCRYADQLQPPQNHRSTFVLFHNTNENEQPASQLEMQAARKAPKRSAAVFDNDGNSPTAKRQRFASSPSQDSNENGQTPLGITFGDPVPAIAQDKDAEIEIADSQEDIENEETPVKKVKKAKKASSKKKSVHSVNDDEKDSPERASVSSINIADIPVMTSPKDVQIRLGAKQFMFSPRECKAIVRWMRMHRTYKISSHKTEFNELMHHLGYTSALLSQKDQNELRTKLRTKMAALHTNMKKTGGKLLFCAFLHHTYANLTRSYH